MKSAKQLKEYSTVCNVSFARIGFSQNKPVVTFDVINVNAPFGMPLIQVANYSRWQKFTITDLGAVQGDKEKTPRP